MGLVVKTMPKLATPQHYYNWSAALDSSVLGQSPASLHRLRLFLAKNPRLAYSQTRGAERHILLSLGCDPKKWQLETPFDRTVDHFQNLVDIRLQLWDRLNENKSMDLSENFFIDGLALSGLPLPPLVAVKKDTEALEAIPRYNAIPLYHKLIGVFQSKTLIKRYHRYEQAIDEQVFKLFGAKGQGRFPYYQLELNEAQKSFILESHYLKGNIENNTLFTGFTLDIEIQHHLKRIAELSRV